MRMTSDTVGEPIVSPGGGPIFSFPHVAGGAFRLGSVALPRARLALGRVAARALARRLPRAERLRKK
jgi:hypothetical protein